MPPSKRDIEEWKEKSRLDGERIANLKLTLDAQALTIARLKAIEEAAVKFDDLMQSLICGNLDWHQTPQAWESVHALLGEK